METGPAVRFRVDQLLLDLAAGGDFDALIEAYAPIAWNEGLIRAATQIDLLYPNRVENQQVSNEVLFEALAHPQTTDRTRAEVIIRRGTDIAMTGQPAKPVINKAISVLRQHEVNLGRPEAEAAWLEVGKLHSEHAKIPGNGLNWALADSADYFLASLEPYVGAAPALRAWACSNDCALPNTVLAFRRGKLRLDAARAREEGRIKTTAGLAHLMAHRDRDL